MENMSTNVKCKGLRDVQKVHPQMECILEGMS